MDVKKFLLIRHGKTRSNLKRRYIGGTDEALCAKGSEEVKDLAYSGELPSVSMLYSGLALRCRQTAELLFPDLNYHICQMREIDFGVFNGKSADNLLGDKQYEAWLETGCMGDIPGGDSVLAFKERCCETFLQIAGTCGAGTTALVVHGGNIMAILERFAAPKQNFYDYQIPNCGFFLCRYENGTLVIERKST